MAGTKVMSEKLKREQADRKDAPAPLVRTARRDRVVRIAPITTLNDWVVIIPFLIETTIELSEEAERRNVGIVVGVSQTMMTPHGEFVPSRLKCGDVVLFQKNAKVGDMTINCEPYVGQKLIIISERNVVCKLPPVPFEIVDRPIDSDQFAV